MTAEDVLAVVVSYDGREKTRLTVEALRGQVGHIHIVDNGSGAESLSILESLEQTPGVTIERLGENRGVGHALNRGVMRARAMGCPWLLTMDQDSVIDRAMIAAYTAAIERDPARVCLAPAIENNGATRVALFAFLAISTMSVSRGKAALTLLIVFLASIYQRPNILMLPYLLVLLGGAVHLRRADDSSAVGSTGDGAMR